MAFGLTTDGYTRKTLDEIIAELQTNLEAVFGEINWEPDSVFSQLVGEIAKPLADVEERLEEVYYSQYPNTSEGFSLDSVSQLLGTERLAATKSTDTLSLIGDTGTVVPIGFLCTVPETLENFESLAAQTIEAADCNECRIRAAALGDNLTWTTTINGVLYSYTDPLGGGFPTEWGLAQLLAPIIQADPNRAMNATAVADSASTGYVQLTSVDEITGYAVTVNANMGIDNNPISSPVNIQAINTGAILVLADTITEIVNPVVGLDSINNPAGGVVGRALETDVELRVRRLQALAEIGASTIEAIRAQILERVENVTSCVVYENETGDIDTIVITTNIDYVTGNDIDITVNGTPLATVSYATSHANTMSLVAAAIQGVTEVLTAVVSGAREITVTADLPDYVSIDSFVVTSGASQAVASISGSSRPGHSIEVIAEGGLDADLANQIWLSKAGGIRTHGGDSEIVTDSMLVDHTIYFTRPTEVDVWVDVVMTYNPEQEFPSGGLADIEAAILAIGQAYETGDDVIVQAFLSAVYATPGVATASITVATGASPGSPPFGSSANIVIGENQKATFIAARITSSIS